MAISKVQRKNSRGFAYRVRVDAGYDPRTRKRRQFGKTVLTMREARELEAELIRQVATGTQLQPDRVTVSDLLDEWLRIKATDVTSNTVHDYRITIKKRIVPAFGSMQVQELTTSTIQGQITDWQSEGLGARQIRDAIVRLRQGLDFAVDMGIVHQNAADKVRIPRLKKPVTNAWEAAEVARFLQQAEAMPNLTRAGDTGKREPDALWPLWPLLALEGMRRGEALGLTWKSINFERGTATIQQTVILDKANAGAPLLKSTPKTSSGRRTIRLTERTLVALRNHRLHQNEQRLQSQQWQAHDLIVCTRDGKPVAPANVTRSFERVRLTAGLRKIRVHDLRHSAASLLIQAGVPVKVVSDRLGHGTVQLTLDRYQHVLKYMDDNAAAAMDAAMETALMDQESDAAKIVIFG